MTAQALSSTFKTFSKNYLTQNDIITFVEVKTMELQKEVEYYQANKEELLKHYKDKFALIKGEELMGTYTTWEEAFNEGVEKLGNVPFLIKQVREQDEIIQSPALAVGAISACSHTIYP